MNGITKFGAPVLAATIAMGAPALAQNTMVGGAEMLPSKTIVENASASADHTTLVAAVQAAGLVETLSGPGHSPSSPRPTRPSRSCPTAPSRTC